MDTPKEKKKEEKRKPKARTKPKAKKKPTNEKKNEGKVSETTDSKSESKGKRSGTPRNNTVKGESKESDSKKSDTKLGSDSIKKKKRNKKKNNDDKSITKNNSGQNKKNVKAESKSVSRDSSRSNKREVQRLQAAAEQNYKKLVVRLLPPLLSEKKFWITIDPSVSENKSDYFESNGIIEYYFHQGGSYSKFSQLSSKRKSYSRMYIIFKDFECARKFTLRIKDLVFTDDEGNSNKPGLKISQYVKLFISTSKRSRIDNSNLEGTIEDDDIFKHFLKSLDYVKSHQFDEDMDGISMLRPIASELKLRRKRREAATKAAELALTKLSGVTVKSKKKVKKDNKADNNDKSKKKKRRRKRKSKEERLGEKSTEGNNKEIKNMVILEKAGQKVLRERQKNERKNVSTTSLPALKAISSNNSCNGSLKTVPKVLKRAE